MKKILKRLPFGIMCMVSFTVISIIDGALLLIAMLGKAMRSVMAWLIAMFEPDTDTNEFRKSVETGGNLFVNLGYKHYIDLLYPTEEDFEDDDEDESYYNDDED